MIGDVCATLVDVIDSTVHGQIVQGYLQAFGHPEVTREQLQQLLDAVSGFLDTVTARDGEFAPRGGWAPHATADALQLERALELALAERDRDDRARARHREARDRIVAAVLAMRTFGLIMPHLIQTEISIGTTALNEGFEVYVDGTIRPSADPDADICSDHREHRRSELERQMTAAVATRTTLLDSTADALRKHLDLRPENTETSWVIDELTHHDPHTDFVAQFAEAVPLLPDCDLKHLLARLVDGTRQARERTNNQQ
ncbi:hypothetical protein NWFMUON74_09680 [Nocardia wallacei]|uniref:Uncharacterized protein n=1 Tax=Nocardia wallacei TaxID=480035 RepID=A0A7G1KF59_9NOCA|nr:hypothetical protein NWFMUON74_09680 [Nocardia wallacei]